MLNHKYRMYFIAFATIALISIVLALFHGSVISRSLAERVLASSASASHSVTVVKEQSVSPELPILKPARPSPTAVALTAAVSSGNVAKERSVSLALPTLKTGQPSPTVALTSERFIRSETKLPVKTQGK